MNLSTHKKSESVADSGGAESIVKKNLYLPFFFSIYRRYPFAYSVNRFKSQHPRD